MRDPGSGPRERHLRDRELQDQNCEWQRLRRERNLTPPVAAPQPQWQIQYRDVHPPRHSMQEALSTQAEMTRSSPSQRQQKDQIAGARDEAGGRLPGADQIQAAAEPTSAAAKGSWGGLGGGRVERREGEGRRPSPRRQKGRKVAAKPVQETNPLRSRW
jgi:hypothetical protein